MEEVKKTGKIQEYGVFISKLQRKLIEEIVLTEDIYGVHGIKDIIELLENGFWKKLRVQKDTLREVLELGDKLQGLIDSESNRHKYIMGIDEDCDEF